MNKRYVRLRELASTKDRPGRYPVNPSTIWRWVAAGTFPRPYRFGDLAAWAEDELDEHDRAAAVRPTVKPMSELGRASVAKRRAKATA